MVEGEPQVNLGAEEMDAKTVRNMMAAMQEELAALRANQEIVAEMVVLQLEEN